MKKIMLRYIALPSLLLAALSSCEKKVEPIDSYDVVVDYRSSNQYAITADKEVNPKDSIFFDFTVTSPTDIAYIEIQRNGVRIDTFRATGAKTFSATKGYRIDSAAGDYSYRILARDAQATYLGDGGKVFKITVKPDFYFWSYRIVEVPDTAGTVNKSFYSTVDGKTYTFQQAGAASASVDFAYYFDTTGVGTPSTTDNLGHTFYATSAPRAQLPYHDMSSWTKNATVFKKMPSSVNFVSQLTSAGAINNLIAKNMTSGTAAFVNMLATSAGNNVIGFRTAAGKYGAILVRYVDGNSPASSTELQVDVKVQK